MQIAAEGLDAEAAYKLLVGSVVPRPIAWVTTMSRAGRVNAAPFSAFTFVSNKPPMVGVSIGRKAGALKDTARNILDTGEFVVNIANESQLETLHLTAQEFPDTVSEIDALAIEVAASTLISPPRIADAPVSFECVLHQSLEFGDFRSNFFVGEVRMFHVRDGCIANGKIDTQTLRPIARLGGPHYAQLGATITMKTIAVSEK